MTSLSKFRKSSPKMISMGRLWSRIFWKVIEKLWKLSGNSTMMLSCTKIRFLKEDGFKNRIEKALKLAHVDNKTQSEC